MPHPDLYNQFSEEDQFLLYMKDQISAAMIRLSLHCRNILFFHEKKKVSKVVKINVGYL